MEWTEGRVTNNLRWTANLFSLRIDVDIAPFTAGQFTSLALDLTGERIARPYSILSAPGESPLEFYFYIATDGVLSYALAALGPASHRIFPYSGLQSPGNDSPISRWCTRSETLPICSMPD